MEVFIIALILTLAATADSGADYRDHAETRHDAIRLPPASADRYMPNGSRSSDYPFTWDA